MKRLDLAARVFGLMMMLLGLWISLSPTPAPGPPSWSAGELYGVGDFDSPKPGPLRPMLVLASAAE